MKESMSEIFGCDVFGLEVMKAKLPKEIYKKMEATILNAKPIDEGVAEVVATAMKDWAIGKGATHFTHWFQPMTGITAEKHDCFFSSDKSGKAMPDFSGKELVKGEPDASSFPSGGLRATFEARGYTAWDPTSCAFVKDGTLYIPTVFTSYSGEVLDKKTPLLRSMEAVNKQALRVLKYFDSSAQRVYSTVGAEQEYFLVDKKMYEKREDLILCGRTLFGAKPPKGQELEDHYFGRLKPRVAAFMADLDKQLWKLGIPAKTKHNEVAPAQHELAVVFTSSNIATDNNQLVMETMHKVAEEHGLVCLLNEKPFEYINGSGKHNNWSLSTNTGENLLGPGKEVEKDKRFLLFLSAVLKAVDDYADLLRVTVATAGNDHRLGANEAPPAVVSVFVGDDLEHVIESIVSGKPLTKDACPNIATGVTQVPAFAKDATDRNRTSPFAFTGNKFEFRMVGSAQSLAGINFTLNAIVAQSLKEFADRLDKTKKPEEEIDLIVKETLEKHQRIIFNGNGYTDEWIKEAEKRGLPNLANSVEAYPVMISEKNIKLFAEHGILTETETRSRYEIIVEDYVKQINIEAETALDMARKQLIPAAVKYTQELLNVCRGEKDIFGGAKETPSIKLLHEISNLTDETIEKTEALSQTIGSMPEEGEEIKKATFMRDEILKAMNELRIVCDKLETMVSKEIWPLPTYSDLLFYC